MLNKKLQKEYFHEFIYLEFFKVFTGFTLYFSSATLCSIEANKNNLLKTVESNEKKTQEI